MHTLVFTIARMWNLQCPVHELAGTESLIYLYVCGLRIHWNVTQPEERDLAICYDVDRPRRDNAKLESNTIRFHSVVGFKKQFKKKAKDHTGPAVARKRVGDG